MDSAQKKTKKTKPTGNKKKLASLSNERINKLARDILDGRSLTSHQVPENLWMSVFMPLFFMKKEDISEDMYTVYGDPDSCNSGRCINGYPIYFSCGFLNKEDTRKVFNQVEKLRRVLKEAELKDQEKPDKSQTTLKL